MEKGTKIRVTGNSIFEMMGFQQVTGEVIIERQDKSGCSFKCDQTGCMETLDYDDGDIQVES